MDKSRTALAYGVALVLGLVAVAPFVEIDGRFILEPDTPFDAIRLYYDTWRSGAWGALPAPDPNVYFEGHSLIYGLVMAFATLVHGAPAAFDQAAVVCISLVNAAAHIAATVVMFTTLRRLAAYSGIALALTALFAFSPQILDIDMVRIDRLMILPLVVILDISIRIARGEATWRHGILLGIATAVIATTKISGFAFAMFPATAMAIAAIVHGRSRFAEVFKVAGASLAAGVPLLAFLMIRFVLHGQAFIAGLKTGYAMQMAWTAVFPSTPRLYYNVDLFAGYGVVFLGLALASVIVVAFEAVRRREPVSVWLIVNLAVFSALGAAAFKYPRGGYHLVPLYLYAMAIAARRLSEAVPARRLRLALAVVLILLFLPLGRTASAYSKSATVASARAASITQTRFAARDWIVMHFTAGARICMMGSSQWANPQLAGLGFHVTTRSLDFPYLSRATMIDFMPPRLDQLRAACDGVVFNDLHKNAYVENFRTFGLTARFEEWRQLYRDLEHAYPPQVFTAVTPAYYVSRVEVYDLRGVPVRGNAGSSFVHAEGVADGNSLRLGDETLAVEGGTVTGAIDNVRRYSDALVIEGWAADAGDHKPTSGVIFALGNTVIGGDGTATARRPDVAAALNVSEAQAAGFSTCIQTKAEGRLRVFAVTPEGKVGELGDGQEIVPNEAAPDAALPAICRSAE